LACLDSPSGVCYNRFAALDRHPKVRGARFEDVTDDAQRRPDLLSRKGADIGIHGLRA